ncbi:precorrin-2 C(20)-methyltransferase [compost metagenome]
MGLTANASYVERVSLDAQRMMPLGDVPEDTAPYFSQILIYKGAEGWNASPQARSRNGNSA